MHAELVSSAVTVECDKRSRGNLNAPDVAAKFNQSGVQFDWFISAVRVHGVLLSEWCAALNLPVEWFRISTAQPFKTKKAALLSVVDDFVHVLSVSAPEWDTQDEEDAPEHFALIAALKGSN